MSHERTVELQLPASRFVGRRAELARLDMLFSAGRRLVTLWGPAGMGKTRLALQFASSQVRRVKGAARAYFCELDEARDAAAVAASVARGLDAPLPAGARDTADLVERVGHLLRARGPCLLVLDNFEQVVHAAAETVGRWLHAAPEARFLVTSRERLRIDGELTEELGPLSLPQPGAAADRSDAVELFLDRAEVQGFHATDVDRALVVELVEALEGIPLAIELAAGRIDTLGLHGMIGPLRAHEKAEADASIVSVPTPRLSVLAGPRRDMRKRQMTLRAAIAWSWDLLSETERRGLAQCSVFRGGFSPAAAARVIDLGEDSDVEPLDVVQSLRNKSLLKSYQTAPGEVRLALYESVREFAAEKLERSPMRSALEARHAAYYMELGERLADRGADGARVLGREIDNLMSIATRALAAPADAALALGALLAVDPLIWVSGPIGPHLAWLDRALAAADGPGGVPPLLRARALHARGRAQAQRGHAAAGFADLEAALEAARATGNRREEGAILADLGVAHHHGRDMEQAKSFYEKALAMYRGIGDRRAAGRVIGNLGALYHDKKSFDEAFEHYTRALAVFREFGDRSAEGIFLTNLGILENERGSRDEARALLERALSLLEQVGDRRLEAITLTNLGALHHEDGRTEEARTALGRALERIRQAGDRRSEGLCLARLGAVLADEGAVDEATDRFAAAEAILDASADAIGLEVVAVGRAFLDLVRAKAARAKHAEREGDAHLRQARGRIARALAGGPNRPAPAEISDDVRSLVRVLERALAKLETGELEALGPPADALLVGPDAHWFRPPNGAWQDLRKHRQLRLLLLRLCEERERAEGAALSLDALREAGWPGESISYEAAVNRVHVALAALRKRGLKAILLRTDDGYRLDAGVVFRRVPAALCPS